MSERKANATPPRVLVSEDEFLVYLALEDELRALARLFRPRLLVPDERVIRAGDRGNAMFMISSGAVEVVLPNLQQVAPIWENGR